MIPVRCDKARVFRFLSWTLLLLALPASMLAQNLAGVVSQALLSKADGSGRIAATELLKATPTVGAAIRESRTQDIPGIIQSSKAMGMHSLDDSLLQLVSRGIIRADEAHLHAMNKPSFESSSNQDPEVRKKPKARIQRTQAAPRAPVQPREACRRLHCRSTLLLPP